MRESLKALQNPHNLIVIQKHADYKIIPDKTVVYDKRFLLSISVLNSEIKVLGTGNVNCSESSRWLLEYGPTQTEAEEPNPLKGEQNPTNLQEPEPWD